MNTWLVIAVSFGYIFLLFLVAFIAQKKSEKRNIINHPLIYALSLGVYCTAWTFYGSVGRATNDGISFLAVYIGPTLLAPLWWIVLRKIIRISKVQRITTIADFISARYGKNISLGSIVTIFCFVGIIPYIALQLKAISESFDIITDHKYVSDGSYNFIHDSSLYVMVIMAVFTLMYGTRKISTNERHPGMVAAIAVESIVKLLAFLLIGIFLAYFVYNGFGDIFSRAMEIPELKKLMTISSDGGGFNEWFWITLASAIAFILLPRQFQVSVVENRNERHIKTSMWLFPLYMLLINLFVLPVAFGGSLLLSGSGFNSDYYLLGIPLQFNQNFLALFIFIGGISAATSMIIVETMALSTMFSNNLLLPFIVGNRSLKQSLGEHLSTITLWSRRFSIVLILLLAFLYYHSLDRVYSLVSIGLISFVSVAQFAPAMVGGIFWKKGTKNAAVASILVGFVVWSYTLVLPSLVPNTDWGKSILEFGPFGISALKPLSLFGLEGWGQIPHAMFWSMFFNIGTYVLVSFCSSQTQIEKNQSEIFVDIFKYSAVYESSVVWKGRAYMTDIEALLAQFFGKERSRQVLTLFAKKHNIEISQDNVQVDPRLVAYSERLLSGVIGSASARIMMSSVVTEEDLRMEEVLDILKESQQVIASNRELKRKSVELKSAMDELALMNERLKETDELKDDFLSTVTHELRTPITSIRAFSEIVHDNPELELEDRQHYLNIIIKETERLSRLISQVLDLERYESGRQRLTLTKTTNRILIDEAVEPLKQLMKEKGIVLNIDIKNEEDSLVCDTDKIIQVLNNLLTNSMKFVEQNQGVISIVSEIKAGNFIFRIEDNGKGVATEFQELIFEKFFQAKNQLIKKPKGSGLGLAICRNIMELHKGGIMVASEKDQGAVFTFYIPQYLERLIESSEQTTREELE